jgi:hypothetical protein
LATNDLIAPSAPGRLQARSRVGARSSLSQSSAWAWALGFLVLVIWLVPIKTYKLPVALPFNLELYRLVIIVLLVGWMLVALRGMAELRAGGLGPPLLLFGAAAAAGLLVNHKSITADALETQSVKSLSYLLSFLIAFVLVYSTIRTLRDVDIVLTAVVGGALVVAVAALVEQRTKYNVFNHLQAFLPFLDQAKAAVTKVRFGRLRVQASAQHPIALGAALVMCVPLAIYLSRRAAGAAVRRLWLAASLVLCAAALATQSRTVLTMIVAMTVVGLWLRKIAVLRWWPLIPVLLIAVHFAAPRTLSGLYHALAPKGGIVAEQQLRSGVQGSGRLADIRPGLRLWETKPIFGQGPGTAPVRGAVQAQQAQGGTQIIFDDQYLRELVEGGIVGLIALVWIVWGAFIKIGIASKRATGPPSDLLVATCAACAGYAMGMLTFDSLSFVQVTLLFFVIAAIGLRTAALVSEPEEAHV